MFDTKTRISDLWPQVARRNNFIVMTKEKERLALLLNAIKEADDERMAIEKNKLAMLLHAIQGPGDEPQQGMETTENSV